MRERGDGRRRLPLGRLAVIVSTACALMAAAPEEPLKTSDDQTFRPTVIVRKGNSQGSGTIIASVENETLVLTAAHVLEDAGPVTVELHRYNLGVERAAAARGWPVQWPGEVVATDAFGDVGVVRIRGHRALPYVARLAPADRRLQRGSVVTSVGVDGGAKLDAWSARVLQVAWFGMATEVVTSNGRGVVTPGASTRRAEPNVERPFFITSRAPREGRSGGGLFLEGDRLVGVCVGRIEPRRGKPQGVFAAGDTIHQLLRENDLQELIDRSDQEHRPRTPRTKPAPSRPAPTVVR